MKYIDYTYLSELFISTQDRRIYNQILLEKRLNPEHLTELYTLNLLLCKELYLIICQLEKMFKYKIHYKMTILFGHSNWFNAIEWSEEVLSIIESRACLIPEPVVPENLLDVLPLNFIKHLFDYQYVQTLYCGGIDSLFTNYPKKMKLRRTSLKKIIVRAIIRKNELISGFVIIDNIQELLRDYRRFMQFIYWLDKDYFFMTARITNFIKYYRRLNALYNLEK